MVSVEEEEGDPLTPTPRLRQSASARWQVSQQGRGREKVWP